MPKLRGAERARALDAIVQSDAIDRIEGFEPTEFVKELDQAVLDGLARFAQVAEELEAYITEHRTTDGFLESRPWLASLEGLLQPQGSMCIQVRPQTPHGDAAIARSEKASKYITLSELDALRERVFKFAGNAAKSARRTGFSRRLRRPRGKGDNYGCI